MKQIIQNLRNGNTILEEVPAPLVRKGCVLIQTQRSLVSLGTEKMLVEFGKGNLISKAKQQPEKVKQVLDKIKTEGLLPTLEAVFNKLDEPLPLGYCNAGVVVAVGEGVKEFKVGDRVASNGHHAEVVCIPQNLCAKIPDEVSDEDAAFTVIGSIAMQGIRLVTPTFGETVVVIGLGLVGLITVQLLQANGCRVIGFDLDEKKISLAQQYGALAFNSTKVEVVKTVEELTENSGCDAVIITASSKSNDIISQSAQMSRKQGRIVLVGVVGLDIQRADFFKKELTFQVSCSYGAGRYDDDYEQKGIDYPLPYVRWTEKRNFEAILFALAHKKLSVSDLITERVLLEHYQEIYNNLGGNSIASILEYTASNIQEKLSRKIAIKEFSTTASNGVVGIIGAGNFTKMTMLPALKNCGASFKYIASAGGLTAKSLANKYGFAFSTTDYKEILQDSDVDLVMITTRHNQHAAQVIEALKAGKHVFVEKPLALNLQELQEIEAAYTKSQQTLSVGYNRRFSPFIQKAKELLGNNNVSINMIATVNAGFIPADIWVHDLKIGGGRIMGEACHFIDLMIYLSGSKVKEVTMNALGNSPSENTDNAIITLAFENGSQGAIHYFANGNKGFSKEKIEVYSQGRILVLDNFRKLEGFGFKGFSSMKSRLDKGHKQQFQLLLNTVKKGGESLIPFEEIVNGSKASFAAIESLKQRKWIAINELSQL